MAKPFRFNSRQMLHCMDTHSFFVVSCAVFSDVRLGNYMKDVIYGGTSLPAFFRPPLIGGLLFFLISLPFAVLKDAKRQKQLRYGRRLKGPEMLTPRQFNRVVKGAGIGFKIDGMRKMLRIPARAEAQHMQIIGDTGAGKSALMFQLLRQVQSRVIQPSFMILHASM